MTSTILISGANRGIGLELARQFAEGGWQVIGTARDPAGASALRETGATVMPLEATDPASIAALTSQLAGQPIDVLIANAGIAFNLGAPPAQVTRADFVKVIRTNTIAPFMLATALKPNILASGRKVVSAMSSLMSSIGANDWGTQYTYRASKTALNASWKALAREWAPEGITAFLLRPGMVATDMTEGQGIDVTLSVAGMKKVVEGLGTADAGRIIGYDGFDVPW
ncbi:SDR family oxidoreductase [Pseudogemmobacter sonorensis]|uniref:SDR family oxidoreductase n=1 Tax=Pseudogemmobacter sonorensis TaxID=2989681 RepID=UPI0036C7FAAD